MGSVHTCVTDREVPFYVVTPVTLLREYCRTVFRYSAIFITIDIDLSLSTKVVCISGRGHPTKKPVATPILVICHWPFWFFFKFEIFFFWLLKYQICISFFGFFLFFLCFYLDYFGFFYSKFGFLFYFFYSLQFLRSFTNHSVIIMLNFLSSKSCGQSVWYNLWLSWQKHRSIDYR